MATSKAVFQRDRGLQFRMLLTMFLLGLLYVAFVGALLAAGAGAALVAVVIGGLALLQLFTSDKLALALLWTAYCIVGPRLKERRYVRRHGEAFRHYQAAVPYMAPGRGKAA